MSDSVKTIYVDIDDTICYTNKTDYANSIPYKDRINKIKRVKNVLLEIFRAGSMPGAGR